MTDTVECYTSVYEAQAYWLNMIWSYFLHQNLMFVIWFQVHLSVLIKASSQITFISIVLPRDVIRKRGLCCRPVSVCPSLRLSVTFVCCIQIAKYIVKLLSRPISPCFNPKRRYPIAGALNTQGGENCDFRLELPFISKTVRSRLMVAMKRQWEVTVTGGGSIRVSFDNLEWPWKAEREVKIFRRIYLITLVPFDQERQNSAG